MAIGSNLSIVNGALVLVRAGAITLLNSQLELAIIAAGVAIDPGAGGALVVSGGIVGGIAGEGLLKVELGAWLEVRSGSFAFSRGVFNFAGRVSLFEGTTTAMLGLASDSSNYIQRSFFGAGGITEMYGYSVLVCSEGIELDSGSFRTFQSKNGFTSVNVITSEFYLKGGNVIIDYYSFSEPQLHSFGTLAISGNATWSGGAFYAYIYNDVNWVQSDQWDVGGTLTLVGGQLYLQALDDNGVPVSPRTDGHWNILHADSGITFTGEPTYDDEKWLMERFGPMLARSDWYATGL